MYGNCHGAWVTETRPVSPDSDRAGRRVDAECRLRAFGRRCGVSVGILRAPGIYAGDRLPVARLERGDPVLRPEDDVHTNHIHAEDLARWCAIALFRGGAGRVWNACDDTRLTMGGAAAAGESLPEGSLGTIPASALPGEAGPLFVLAKSKLIQFDYAGAEEAFRAFLERFGDDPQAGEAHYWLGESLYQQKAYADSGAAYTTMIRSYPDNPRAPDALGKLARAMRLIGDKEKACLALGTLPSRYPNASGVTRDLAAVERTKSGCDN